MNGDGRIRTRAEMSVVLKDKDGKPVEVKPEDRDHDTEIIH
jgi:hypothetical protein